MIIKTVKQNVKHVLFSSLFRFLLSQIGFYHLIASLRFIHGKKKNNNNNNSQTESIILVYNL